MLMINMRVLQIADYLTNPQLLPSANTDSSFLRQFYAGN